ncbi:uncharacterized protein LOC131668040 [Phymastichus coffea]|uniref:uncharacterized protein LOC131668040 n=1 Tax=Phymastichus coffea TaxID=108790 RepID=UPI00273B1114|nr:uncharacterized protein LOC131668040 [Phymastichus coffea]XP_058797846.1 uncharacterized protein LOC131668040 [Phymastichus coffea]XP_058797847.1 uncharacterized protein LOC131668040 [Phymastichus coffea]
MADEGTMQDAHVNKEYEEITVVSSKSVILKVVEVVISVFCIGLIVDPFNSFNTLFRYEPRPKLDDIVFIYITLGGFIIVNTICILGHLLGDRMPKRTSLLFSVTGSILHVIAGILIIVNHRKLSGNYGIFYNNNQYASKQYMDMMIASCFFTFVNALLFGIDVLFTIKYY